MSEIKLDTKKLNKEIAADLPEVPRDENGKIDLEAITISIDEKNNRIIPDAIFDAYFRELPDKIINQSKTWRTAKGGKIKIFGGDPEADRAIQKAGGESVQAALRQRRSCKEILEDLARMPADQETLDRLGLAEGTNNLEAATFAQYRKAQQGDTKAMEYIRDTVGEKPTDKIDASVTSLTAEDKAMLENIAARLGGNLE